MTEPRHTALARWGDERRRNRAAHRRRRRRSRLRRLATAAAIVAATAALASLAWPPRPALVWNASESSPIGLYAVSRPDEIERGDMVIAWPPASARRIAAERRYLPANVPLVKRVAAAPGDRVCAAGEAVFVNDRIAARRRVRDARGRRLPRWTGCMALGEGEFFLLMAGSAASFDGRYFGVTKRGELVGKARLLWAR